MKHLLLLYSILHAFTAISEEYCQQRKEYFQQERSTIEQSLQANPLTTENIILVGVSHNNYEEEFYPDLIEQLKKSNIEPDCFFLERDLPPMGKEILKKLGRKEEVDSKLIAFYFPFEGLDLIRYLAANNIKMFDIDDHSIPMDDYLYWINSRDTAMAKKINGHMATSCKLALYPVGMYHIASGSPGRNNLDQQLKSLGMETYNIGLTIQGINSFSRQSTGANGKPIEPGVSSDWALSKKGFLLSLQNANIDNFICPDMPKLSHSTYTIDNSPRGNIPSYYNNNDKKLAGQMNDMNFRIYYQCLTEECNSSNSKIEVFFKKIGLSFY